MDTSSATEGALTGRVALVTGANTGIGLVTARELARRGAQVFVACRSLERTRPAMEKIHAETGQDVQFLPLELGDFDSIRACAREFLASGKPLHLLINNAGLAGARGMTKSGFELAFGVNHVGHFLLTDLLLPRIRASAPARIVTVASRAHRRTAGIDWDDVRRPTRGTGVRAYQVSKLANVLFSAELGRRLQGSGVHTYSLHPGVVATEVWREVPAWLFPLLRLRGMISPEEGARTTLYCATSEAAAEQTALYYDECQVRAASAAAQDAALAAELWTRSVAWTQSGA